MKSIRLALAAIALTASNLASADAPGDFSALLDEVWE